MIDIELWHDVKNYEGRYKISNRGNLYSYKYKRILKCTNNNGYKVVLLGWRDNKRRVGIHQLVAETFLSPDSSRPHVNHKDGNPLNNYYINLEWVTPGENQLHAYKIGLRKRMSGEKHFKARLKEDDVRYIRANKNLMSLRQLAEKFDMNYKYIWEVQSGKRWKEVI